MELKNINALKHGKNNLRFKYRGMKIQVLLLGNDKNRFQQRSYKGLDVPLYLKRKLFLPCFKALMFFNSIVFPV
jgi:hypothetical protein